MTIAAIDLHRATPPASDINELPPRVATPVVRPVMVQRWTDVVFLHWRFDPAVVEALLPDGVTVDTHDGSAWVGLVPFQMEGLGIPGLAPLPYVGRFPEVNVRTYVRAGTRRGVWFFSLDVDRLLPAVVARVAYHLPYCSGRADHVRNGDLVVSRVERRWPRADVSPVSEIVVRTGATVDPDDELVRFLTDRWGLISSTRRGQLRYAAVDHSAWSLHRADVVHLADGLVAAAGLPIPHSAPCVMWSPGVDVRVGRPQRAI